MKNEPPKTVLKEEMKKAVKSAPQEGDKDNNGKVYSNGYGGFVPGLYAQGR